MGTNIDRRTTLVALAGSVLAGCGGGGDGILGVSSPPPLLATATAAVNRHRHRLS